MQDVKAQILLVDDHPVSRAGVDSLISSEKDLQVCAHAGTAREAIAKVEEYSPTLAVIDINLPDRSGLELIKDLRTSHPSLLMLALSMHEEKLFAERVLRAGGKGYLMKNHDSESIIEAIRKVLDGEIYVSKAMSTRILERMTAQGSSFDIDPLEQLSDRECELFQAVGEGLSIHDICAKLQVSRKTVDIHRNNIRDKLKLRDNHHFTIFAVKWVETGRLGNPDVYENLV